jgi:hypothetical protein
MCAAENAIGAAVVGPAVLSENALSGLVRHRIYGSLHRFYGTNDIPNLKRVKVEPCEIDSVGS